MCRFLSKVKFVSPLGTQTLVTLRSLEVLRVCLSSEVTIILLLWGYQLGTSLFTGCRVTSQGVVNRDFTVAGYFKGCIF